MIVITARLHGGGIQRRFELRILQDEKLQEAQLRLFASWILDVVPTSAARAYEVQFYQEEWPS